jgi:acyl-coenzyme A synthetase/AMP-(fatty) acid ligase
LPVAATDPLYILYTSGTTGQPKGVVRDNGGHMVALKWSMHAMYGVKPGEVFWAASDVGWVVGHSYIVYAPLLHGCTTIVFEGKPVGTPDAGTFWRVISEHKVAILFTAPTAFRAIKQGRPEGGASSANTICLGFPDAVPGGERADPDTIEWARDAQGAGDRPLVADRNRLDHCRQSDGAWLAAGKYGSPAVPMPGYDVQVLDDAGHPVAPASWEICVKLPLPPVMPADAVECRRALQVEPTSPSSPDTTRRRTPATSTRTATCSSWRARTTSSTSPVTGCRPVAWRKVLGSSGRGRMRGDRHCRQAEGPDPDWLHRAQQRA